jgi:glycosyltransferase involved in cell wall biosynthesis
MEELYSNAYIYCLPSDLEGMPLSLLEAMSYGNCCVTSDIKELTEVIPENKYVFKKTNIKHLGETLQFLIDNPNVVKKYQDISQEYILNKYNWDNVVKETLKLYEKEGN